jgi:hypothetical protein
MTRLISRRRGGRGGGGQRARARGGGAPPPRAPRVVLAPPPTVLDNDAPRTGRYRIGGHQVLPSDEGATPFSYADLAVALLDEIDTPKHHRAVVAVAP